LNASRSGAHGGPRGSGAGAGGIEHRGAGAVLHHPHQGGHGRTRPSGVLARAVHRRQAHVRAPHASRDSERIAGFSGCSSSLHRPQAGRAWVQRNTQTNRPCFSFFRAWAPDTWGRGRWRHRRNNEVEKDKLAMTVRTPAPLLNSLSHTSDTVCRLSGACVWLRRGGFESLSHLTQSPTAPA
jgi:hypothetical protein